jgi:hypothetical protein
MVHVSPNALLNLVVLFTKSGASCGVWSVVPKTNVGASQNNAGTLEYNVPKYRQLCIY